MGGLAVATLLTLVFLPALYVAWFRIKRPHSTPSQDMAVERTAVFAP
jgi:multidrug efflux pump